MYPEALQGVILCHRTVLVVTTYVPFELLINKIDQVLQLVDNALASHHYNLSSILMIDSGSMWKPDRVWWSPTWTRGFFLGTVASSHINDSLVLTFVPMRDINICCYNLFINHCKINKVKDSFLLDKSYIKNLMALILILWKLCLQSWII